MKKEEEGTLGWAIKGEGKRAILRRGADGFENKKGEKGVVIFLWWGEENRERKEEKSLVCSFFTIFSICILKFEEI